MVALGIVAALIAAYFAYRLFLTRPDADIRDSPNSNVVDMIFLDASWFHKLYIRWSLTDWSLTFLAAGTAVQKHVLLKDGRNDLTVMDRHSLDRPSRYDGSRNNV
jgi:hypothetical protein